MIGVILLAAGESARLGAPKQLLIFEGETLLRRSVRIALAVSDKVVVVFGAKIELMRREIEDLPVQMAKNENWQTGMSGSLKIALEKLLESHENLAGVLILVCDQPYVDEQLLAEIIAKFTNTDCLIAACEYQNTLGVPALFAAELFPKMLALDSRSGAKYLIKKYQSQTAAVPFPAGAFDIDTPEDYARLSAHISLGKLDDTTV